MSYKPLIHPITGYIFTRKPRSKENKERKAKRQKELREQRKREKPNPSY